MAGRFEQRVAAAAAVAGQVTEHGQLSPRRRLELLFDGGTYKELGRLALQAPLPFGKDERVPGDGVLCAFGEVGGRPAFAVANIYAYMGGSIGVQSTRKIAELYRLAGEVGGPVVTFAESGGARLQEGVDIMEACGWEWSARAKLSGVVPQLVAVMGPCIGAAAVTAAMSDLIFWTKAGVVAMAGPKVVKQATGQDLGYAEIGGPELHGQHTGLCHQLFPSEEALIEGLREVIAWLPANNAELAPDLPTQDPVDRPTPEIAALLAKAGADPFDCRELVLAVVDDRRFLELQPDYAPSLVAGLAHLGGQLCGVVANQSLVMAGALDTDACRKAARFLQFCNAFQVPLVTLVDVPGALPTVEECKKGLINGLVRFCMELCYLKVPRVSVLVRKCHGGAYACLDPKSGGGDLVYAYPDSQVGIMSGEALAAVLFKEKAPEMLARLGGRLDDPLLAAERGYIDDLIRPEDTRRELATALRMLRNKRVLGQPPRRTANAPL